MQITCMNAKFESEENKFACKYAFKQYLIIFCGEVMICIIKWWILVNCFNCITSKIIEKFQNVKTIQKSRECSFNCIAVSSQFSPHIKQTSWTKPHWIAIITGLDPISHLFCHICHFVISLVIHELFSTKTNFAVDLTRNSYKIPHVLASFWQYLSNHKCSTVFSQF